MKCANLPASGALLVCGLAGSRARSVLGSAPVVTSSVGVLHLRVPGLPRTPEAPEPAVWAIPGPVVG